MPLNCQSTRYQPYLPKKANQGGLSPSTMPIGQINSLEGLLAYSHNSTFGLQVDASPCKTIRFKVTGLSQTGTLHNLSASKNP